MKRKKLLKDTLSDSENDELNKTVQVETSENHYKPQLYLKGDIDNLFQSKIKRKAKWFKFSL